MIIRAILAIILGALAVLAFSPFDYWIFAFIAYAGLLQLIINQQLKSAAMIGFCWGIGFFGAGIHWVYISIRQYGELSPIIAVLILGLLIAYLSLFPMFFAAVLQKFSQPRTLIQLVVAAPALWQVSEFLRGYILTGFSWLQLGYTQINSPLKAYIPLFGVNGVNLLIPVLCGLLIYLINLPNKRLHKIACFFTCFAFVLLCAIPLGLKHQQWVETDQQRSVKLALVQGNIAQSLKWNRQSLEQTLVTYQNLTEQYLGKADIIIWPETAIPDIEVSNQNYLKQLDTQATLTNTSIAVGIIDWQINQPEHNIFNSLLVLGDEVPYSYPTTNRYNKHHLVPFGEFTPFEWLLSPIAKLLDIPMSSMSSGDYIQPSLMIKGFKFATAICYEIILSQQMWDNFIPETDFILTVSNDTWFGDSIGPWQHLQMARARAVEFGRPLIRSTNNGITVVVDQNGAIIKQLPQFEQNVLTVEISPTTGLTPYAMWGNKPYWIASGLLLLISLFSLRRKKHHEL